MEGRSPGLSAVVLQAVDARRRERSWRERAELAEAALEQARTDTADIKADLARQHNTTQVQLTVQAQVPLVLEHEMGTYHVHYHVHQQR